MNRFFSTFALTIFLILPLYVIPTMVHAAAANHEESVIIEVEENVREHEEFILKNYPLIDVVAVYDTLFQGLALQGKPKELRKLEPLDFIKSMHDVQTYNTLTPLSLQTNDEQMVYPSDLNGTDYTGKGVKVGVIDTGIDYRHPDLEKNYRSGYDVVDLDDDPLETQPEEGMPTLHGTHVAGIIAADGQLQGVAPDAELYAYRALGPGGMGTSVQVIAAMEQAVKEGMDVINLSLGNAVNGPDYPTSEAVNKAVELGVAVVIANGNSGPDHWTVGAPATASSALAVGAASKSERLAFLYDAKEDMQILLKPFPGSLPWNLEKMHPVTSDLDAANVNGKIWLLPHSGEPIYELAKEAEDNGAVGILVYKVQQDEMEDYMESGTEPIGIPIAQIPQETGEWLLHQQRDGQYYIETIYEEVDTKAAVFSSRGPVTVNWQIKPDLLAPGTSILSTVPGGYRALQGTSMAAPHVAGAIALIKEAHPDWSVEKMYSALKTTAARAESDAGIPLPPIVQGMGNIQPEKAVNTETIIYDSLLSFGKMEAGKRDLKTEVIIENTTDVEQTYYFQTPPFKSGTRFHLPKQFTVPAGEKKTIPIELDITSMLLEKGFHQGWLTLHRQNSRETFHLPYLFVHQSAENPKVMGFEFAPQPFSNESFISRFYLAEPAEKVTVDLYDPDTLFHERTLFELSHAEQGMNEIELTEQEIGEEGIYSVLITVHLEDGSYDTMETYVYIP